jgi:hypothetical protein
VLSGSCSRSTADLRGQNPLRVARAAADDPSALEAAREKRRDAVEVGGQHDDGIARSGADVEPSSVDGLFVASISVPGVAGSSYT